VDDEQEAGQASPRLHPTHNSTKSPKLFDPNHDPIPTRRPSGKEDHPIDGLRERERGRDKDGCAPPLRRLVYKGNGVGWISATLAGFSLPPILQHTTLEPSSRSLTSQKAFPCINIAHSFPFAMSLSPASDSHSSSDTNTATPPPPPTMHP
jgi:hypothetical protein